MTAAIDTNILLDILIPDEKYILLSKILVDKYRQIDGTIPPGRFIVFNMILIIFY